MARNYNDVVSAMDSFLQKIAVEKDSAGIQKQAKAEGSSPANSGEQPKFAKAETVSSKGDGEAQGAPGSEKKEDINKEKSTGVSIQQVAANSDGKGSPKDGSDQTFNVLDSEQKVPGIKTSEIKEGQLYKEVTAAQKFARAERLGNAILTQISALAGVQKQAEQAMQKSAEEQMIEKLAAEAYNDFVAGYARGLQKKAEDMNELIEAGVCKTAAEAEALLDSVPPEAKLPEESMPAEGAAGGQAEQAVAGMDPEQAKMLEELAEQMAQAGVKPEDIEEAAKQMEQLTQAGVSPEEIIKATQELAAEQGAAAPAGGEGASQAPGESAGPSPAEQEKAAAERFSVIKNHIRSLARA